jgi:hypothetical protein
MKQGLQLLFACLLSCFRDRLRSGLRTTSSPLRKNWRLDSRWWPQAAAAPRSCTNHDFVKPGLPMYGTTFPVDRPNVRQPAQHLFWRGGLTKHSMDAIASNLIYCRLAPPRALQGYLWGSQHQIDLAKILSFVRKYSGVGMEGSSDDTRRSYYLQSNKDNVVRSLTQRPSRSGDRARTPAPVGTHHSPDATAPSLRTKSPVKPVAGRVRASS